MNQKMKWPMRIGTVMLSLSALIVIGCAPIQEQQNSRSGSNDLIYPQPPDDPRFVYERTI